MPAHLQVVAAEPPARADAAAPGLSTFAPGRASARADANRTDLLMRQAALGTLSAALLHDLASMLQTMTIALDEVALAADSVPGAIQAIGDAHTAGSEMVGLFVEMRKFLRDGEVVRRRHTVAKLVSKVRRLVGARAALQLGELPEVAVSVSEPLFIQVIANIVRNAANASPQGGRVELQVTAGEHEVCFRVIDDGPGVRPEIAAIMFEAFAPDRPAGTGVSLAVAAFVVEKLGGRIAHHNTPDRGACFEVTIPRITG